MADIITDLDHHWTLNDTLAAAVGGQDGAWDADVAGSPTYTAGVIDKAVDLDASDNQRVDLGTDSSLNITGDRTLAAWIYAPAAMTGQRGIISTGSSWTNNSAIYFRDQASNQIAAAFHRVSDNRTYYARAGNLVAESWNHLAATLDESTQTISLYQNGMLVPSSTTTGSTATRDTQGYIGYIGGIASPQYFDGLIDDVRVYSRALTADDVAALYVWRGHIPPALRGRPNLSGLRGRQNIKSIGR